MENQAERALGASKLLSFKSVTLLIKIQRFHIWFRYKMQHHVAVALAVITLLASSYSPA